jgi:hypothetical protein
MRMMLRAVLALTVLAACSGGDGGGRATVTTTVTTADRTAAKRWSADAAKAYAPLELTARELPTRARAWLAGERADADFDADLRTALAEVTQVRDLVAALPAFGPDPHVNELYRASSLLYVEYVGLDRLALATPAGAVRTQLDLAARRVRVLGDRVFDRGQSRLNARLDEPADPNVIINLPPEVPEWVADGLAAGPPLDDPPPPPAATPALREEHRPTQSRAAWTGAVAAAGAPTPAELRAAIAAADPARLRAVARAYDAASRALRDVADPASRFGRDDAAQVRLGYLAAAEAARAAQAGQPDIAIRLAAIAGDLSLT